MNPVFCKNLILFSLKSSIHIPCCKPHFSSRTFFFPFSSQPEKTQVSVHDYLVNQHGFSSSTAEKASLRKSIFKDSKNSDLILGFLRENGFSNTHLAKIIEHFPDILTFKFERTIKPKIKMFQDSGFTQNDVADIIAFFPWVLERSLENRLLPSIVLLKGMLGTTENVCKLLKKFCRVLNHDLEKTLVPNIDFLISCGVSKSQITHFLCSFTTLFLVKPDKMKEYVKRVDDLGLDRDSKMFIHAIRCLSSMTIERWESKLHLFWSLGFSMDEALSIFRRVPNVLAVSEGKLKKIADYLLGNGKCNLAYLVAYPTLFIYSLEGRMKPRIRVWETLMEKNLIYGSYNLYQICSVTDEKFVKKYVFPYQNEVGNLFKSKKVLKK